MKGIITAMLVGAAVAGVIYYLKDNENVQRSLKKLRGRPGYIYDQMQEGWNDAGREVTNALSEQA